MEVDNDGYENASEDINYDYEKLEVRFSVDGAYATLATQNDTVYENMESVRDVFNVTRCKPKCVCRKRKWIGLTLFIILVVILTVSVSMLISTGDTDESENTDSKSKTKSDSSFTQLVSWASSTKLPTFSTPVGYSDQWTITGSLSPSTALYNGHWLPWNAWSTCSSSCGGGIQVRYKSCFQILDCDSDFKEIQECSVSQCPVYASWSKWSPWTKCDTTCGEGFKRRNRTCLKLNTAENDCVGNRAVENTCSLGVCPDCSMTCKTGKLNTECNMCYCGEILSGQVLSRHNGHYAPIKNVHLYANKFVGNLLTITDDLGQFNLYNVCLNTVVRFSKEGFVDKFVALDSTTINVTLANAVKPFISTGPETKARLVGDSVTFCCLASQASNDTYYEWFKDSNVIDENMYPNGTTMSLNNLSKLDQGRYSCRVNNVYGSVRSQEVFLDVQDSLTEFCEKALESKKLELPSVCFQNRSKSIIEVGHCNQKTCRASRSTHKSSKCRDDPRNCCSVSGFKIYHVQCRGFKLPVMKVLACSCTICQTKRIRIFGTVFMYPSKEVAKYFEVHLNGEFKTYTNTKGTFSIFLNSEIESVVLTVQSKNGLSTTKVLALSDMQTGTVYTTIYVVDVTNVVQIEPSKENVINIEKCSNKINGSMAELLIQKFSFANTSFQKQVGKVDISISCLASKNMSEMAVIPGILTHFNEFGDLTPIETFGFFQITAYNAITKTVLPIIKVIRVNVSEDLSQSKDLSLYKINTVSGIYESMPVTDNMLSFIDAFSLNTWLAIGRSKSLNSKCFFRIRVAKQSSISIKIDANRFQLYLQTIHMSTGIFKTYSNTFSTSSSCFETICDNSKGYIEMWKSNIDTRSEEFLLPAKQFSSSNIGLDERKQSLLQYSVAHDSPRLEIIFINTTDGPFFESESTCLASKTNYLTFYFNGFFEDDYTFRPFFDVHSNNSADMQQVSKLVWYQRRAEGYRVCFVKAKIEMLNDQTVTVSAISFGGTNVNITDVVLGIRNAIIFESTSICIEYKCSGTIDEHTSPGDYDFTRVTININHSCSVKSFSQPLIDNFSAINLNNTNSGNFSFYAPTTYLEKFGIYSATSSSGDVESAKADSKGKCRSGKADYSSDNLDTGVAVTFVCP